MNNISTSTSRFAFSTVDPFVVTKASKVFENNVPGTRFVIQDDLLFDCIGIGSGSTSREGRVSGFNYGKGVGYALLQYLASRALGIHRFPLCEDRIYSDASVRYNIDKNLLRQLTEERTLALSNEVLQLNQHTQRQLAHAQLDEVHLRRELHGQSTDDRSDDDYGYTIIRLHQAATLLGRDHIEIEMDTLNSFGDEDAYKRDITLQLTIPARDVLYCSELVASREGLQSPVEGGEWVIINRSPNGVVQVPTRAIVYDQRLYSEDWSFTPERAAAYFDEYMPVVVRGGLRDRPRYGSHGLSPSWTHRLLRYLNIDVRRR